jgi:transglutaminase-like putative cysteine protease
VMALVVIAAGAGLSGMRLTVFHVTAPKVSLDAGPTPSGQGVPQHLITGISLVDHLLATEVTESHTVIFRGTSPVTTYWQVGTLSSFNGTTWLPTTSVRDALSGVKGSLVRALSGGSLPTPVPAQTFTAQVAITDFASRLLPAPPHTVAVSGRPGATIIDEEGVLDPVASAPGTKYTVTSALDTTIAGGGIQLSPFDPRLTPYVTLPTEPAVVTFLAHEAVGSATTPAAEAQALVNWFRSGRFRYTLSPPATGGSNPLVQFLTVTKAGFCEQFAGAYGVLARSLGIPTRLAVGFTAGQTGAGDAFTVTGADAHVWPQVYLGPAAGWVSVEPTPPSVAGSPAAEGVVGATGATGSRTSGVKGTPTVAVPTTTAPTQPRPQPSSGRTPSQHHHASAPPTGVRWWIFLVVGAAVIGLAGLAMLGWRRRRASLEAVLLPDQRVVRAWERALGALQRKGLSRRAEETPGEYAVRMRAAEFTSALPIEADAVANLAALVELACYTSRPCTPAQVADAHALAARIVATNRSHRRRHRRAGRRAQHQRH